MKHKIRTNIKNKKSPVVSLGIFSMPGVESAPKNEYQDTPGVKTVGTNLAESGSLNLPEPSGPHRPVMGLLYIFPCFDVWNSLKTMCRNLETYSQMDAVLYRASF
jgi:hypothetical protein